MESSQNSSNASVFRIFGAAALNAIVPFADFFYILQQEEYSPSRYLHWLPRFFFRRNFQIRDHLKLTARVWVSLAAAVILWLASGAFAAYGIAFAGRWAVTGIIVIWFAAIPFFVLAADWLFLPYYNVVKRGVMRRAAAAIRKDPSLRIVGIAGSFGKTTTKNFIYEFVRYNYATQMIPGNINTPLGIAEWVLRSLKPGTQLLIVEMDGYKAGEIASSAAIAPADIAIITNIGDQHLARFGSQRALAAALKEAFDGAKPSATLLCSSETAQIFGDDVARGGRILEVVGREPFSAVDGRAVARFSDSNQSNLAFALKVAELLKIPRAFVADACQKLELPERRQKVSEWNGYRCVDDSYNISFTTARAGLAAAAALARDEKKKLFAVAAGIPEFGPEEKDANMKLGALLAQGADRVVILKSMFAEDLVRGAADPEKILIQKDLRAFTGRAHEEFPPEEWVALLQPELTDLYY